MRGIRLTLSPSIKRYYLCRNTDRHPCGVLPSPPIPTGHLTPFHFGFNKTPSEKPLSKAFPQPLREGNIVDIPGLASHFILSLLAWDLHPNV